MAFLVRNNNTNTMQRRYDLDWLRVISFALLMQAIHAGKVVWVDVLRLPILRSQVLVVKPERPARASSHGEGPAGTVTRLNVANRQKRRRISEEAETVKHLHRLDANAKGEWYACGWRIEEHSGLPLFHGHNGSNGTFRAQLAVFPDSNLVIACIVNRGGETDPSAPLQAVIAVAQRYAR